MKTVEVPGVGIVEFPDSMTDGEIGAKVLEWTADAPRSSGGFADVLKTAGKIVAPMALPMAGAAAGSLLTGPFAPLGAAGGSMVGEGLNQILGITEPSLQDLLIAGTMPLAGRGAGRAIEGAAKRSQTGREGLHKLAAEKFEAIPTGFRPAQAADDLYALVEKFNPPIDAGPLRSAAERLLKTETDVSKGLKNEPIRRVAQGLIAMIDQHSGQVPFQQLRGDLRRLGDRVGSAAREGGEAYGAYKALFKAGHESLEAAAIHGNPAMPATQALRAAAAAKKLEFVADDLAEILSIKGGGVSPRADGVQVNFGTIIKKIEKNDTIRKTLGDAPYEALLDDLKAMWKRTPNLAAPAGTDAGSKNVARAIGGFGGLGTGVGAFFAGGTGAMIGGGAGAATAALGPMAVAKLLTTESGRKFLRGVLDGTGSVITREVLPLLATAAGLSSPGRAVSGFAADFTRGLVQ
jgi:hypothetical protein